MVFSYLKYIFREEKVFDEKKASEIALAGRFIREKLKRLSTKLNLMAKPLMRLMSKKSKDMNLPPGMEE